MKKLMIVAAAAAMVGGAQASGNGDQTDVIYDLTLSLKTTTGSLGKDSTTTYTLYLGKDAQDAFWYNDAEYVWATNNIPGLAATKKIKGKTIPTFNKNVWKNLDAKTQLEIATALGFDAAVTRPAVNGNSSYPLKSANQWCETLQFRVTTDAACYRVATSRRFTAVVDWDLTADDCCTPGTFLGDALLYRFGAMTSARATKVEYAGQIATGAPDFSSRTADYQGPGAFGTPNNFALAGQGTWGTINIRGDFGGSYTVSGVKTLNGSVVGILDTPDCEFCCATGVGAIAFDPCTDVEISDDNNNSAGTAAFGTFTLKVNQRATNAAN